LAEKPSWQRAAPLGAAIGLAALTRSEALLLVPLLALPAVWLGAPRGARLRPALVIGAGCLAVTVPWLARNWIEFDRPTAISTNEGGLLAGANCDRAYYGELIGSWSCFPSSPMGPKKCDPAYVRRNRLRRRPGITYLQGACFPVPPDAQDRNEAIVSSRLRKRAVDYAGDHAGRIPAVASVRLLRTWELWDPHDHGNVEAFFGDRNPRYNRWAQRTTYVLMLLAIAGAVVLRRRREPLRLLLSLPLLVSLVVVASYGSTRFRAAAEITLVLLAAVVLHAAAQRVLAARAARARV
jgi:hypothetical protein